MRHFFSKIRRVVLVTEKYKSNFNIHDVRFDYTFRQIYQAYLQADAAENFILFHILFSSPKEFYYFEVPSVLALQNKRHCFFSLSPLIIKAVFFFSLKKKNYFIFNFLFFFLFFFFTPIFFSHNLSLSLRRFYYVSIFILLKSEI